METWGGGGAYKERGWGDRCAPSPFPQGAVTTPASWLVRVAARPRQGVACTGCLSDGGAASALLYQGGHLPPSRHSLEFFFFFFGHACVCLSAWQCCPEQSAFSELYGGEAGEPLQICRALCVTDCLVCARFEPFSRLSTLHPLANSRGDLFQV